MSKEKITQATNEELARSEAVDRQVEEMGGCYKDDFDNDWTAMAVHNDNGHCIHYSGTIDGNKVTIVGPKGGTDTHFVMVYWLDGQDLFNSLGYVAYLSKFKDSLEAAVYWAYDAPRLAEEAINRHINRGRTEAAVQKLEKDKDDAIKVVNQQHADKVAALYRKAGINPEDCNL